MKTYTNLKAVFTAERNHANTKGIKQKGEINYDNQNDILG